MFLFENVRNFILQVDVACRAFHQETLDDDDDDGDDASAEGEDGVSPKEVQLFTVEHPFNVFLI